jgi:hypothetical protein
MANKVLAGCVTRICEIYIDDGSAPSEINGYEEVSGIQEVDMDR